MPSLRSGTAEDKARKAAEAIAAYEGRFTKIESDLSTLKSDVNMLEMDERRHLDALSWHLVPAVDALSG
jgi:hypothetical protein